jgi:hypothetical protein
MSEGLHPLVVDDDPSVPLLVDSCRQTAPAKYR